MNTRSIAILTGISILIIPAVAFEAGLRSPLRPDVRPMKNTSITDVVANTVPESQTRIYSYGDKSREFFDEAYVAAAATPLPEIPAAPPRAAVTAHHLLVADRIAALFQALGRTDKPTIVIMSPDHFDAGRSPAQVSRGTWTTPYGNVDSDQAAIDKLLQAAPVLKADESAFPREHGIAAITPFVARSFPGARIVAIALQEKLTAEDRALLGVRIAETLPNAVVIASVDMSHYLPSLPAAFHDELTLRRLAAGGCDCSSDLETDSTAVLDVLLEANGKRGEQIWHLTHHGSSLAALGATANAAWRENTSHILGYFTVGLPVAKHHAAFTLVGDVMLGRSVRQSIDEHGPEYPWSGVTRFLNGTHFTIGNLEGTVGDRPDKMTHQPPFAFSFLTAAVLEASRHLDAVSQANNHSRDYGIAGELQTRDELDEIGLPWFGSWASPLPVLERQVNGVPVTIIGYHAFTPDEPSLLAAVQAARAAGRFTIVMPHWGVEYAPRHSSGQRALAEKIIRAGADLIVGAHPHVTQDIEVIDGIPVVYSLGNFIFDQPMPETRPALALGVIADSERVTLRLLPISANQDGRPEPMDDAAADALLRDLAARSPEAYRADLTRGILNVDRPLRRINP